ncbi:MAG: polyprenyl synthetase family protein [Alphaproteobacteria bacterium]|nr:polyprenyl synthetase family protein [Alphaproteobacteria bacterium]
MQILKKEHAEMNAVHSPLERLSVMADVDMRAVNALILEYMQSDVPLIPKLAQYLIAAGGKRIRPLMTLASGQLFEADMSKVHYLAAAVEFIHTATLLHDDVVDESEERRGQKAANLIFGNQASVLVGDFLFSKSFQMMVESGSLDVLRILSEASAIIAKGEVLQLSTTNDLETTLDDYMKVIESKTAALFSAACEVAPVLAGAPEDQIRAMYDYGKNLGIAFQITDDALDYSANQEKLGKAIGDDFREGKMTAPVIFAIQEANKEERIFWKRTLENKVQSEGDFKTALEIISKHKALDQAMDLAQDYAEKAKNSLAPVRPCETKNILSELADFTISRET